MKQYYMKTTNLIKHVAKLTEHCWKSIQPIFNLLKHHFVMLHFGNPGTKQNIQLAHMYVTKASSLD